MDTQLTAPTIKHAVLAILNSIRQATFHLQFSDPDVHAALTSQMHIGAQGLLEGRLCKRWLPIQQNHYRWMQSRRGAKLWAS